MSKNLTRKGLALGTALAFVVTGLTATAPAYAAAGDVVSIAPTTGTGYGAYNTDYFNIDTTIDTDVVTSTSYSKLAIQIDSPSGADVSVKISDGFVATAATNSTYKLNVTLSDDAGNTTDGSDTNTRTGDANVSDAEGAAEVFTIDFSTTNTHAVLDLTTIDASVPVKLSLNAADTVAKTDNVAVKVTSWIDTDEDEVLESTDKFPSTTETVTFFDAANVTVTPRIERFVAATGGAYLNQAATTPNGFIAGSLSFSPALNLDQINLGANFTFAGAGTTAAATLDTFVPKYLVGNTTYSAAGKIHGIWATDATPAGVAIVASTAYTVSATRTDAGAAANAADNTVSASVSYTTAGYTVPVQATDGTAATTPIAAADVLVDQLDDSLQTTNTTVGLRSGVKTFKYTAKVTPKVAGTSVVSNVPVIAEVTATVLGSGNTLTVNGNKLSDNQAVLVSGVTDADGKFSVSVESSSAKTGEAYTVVFHTLQNSGSYDSTGTYTATYAAGAASVMTQASAILAGSTVEAKYTLKDQFGKVISATSAGTAYTVRLQAGDTTKLKKYATFSNGVATISFANYLAKGQSDSLTAAIGTGVDTAYADATITGGGDTLSASLYNPEAAAAVTTAATLTAKEITYDAFITGAADAVTNVAPASADKFLLTGTVVDTTGAGIPGAVVTVSAKGLQFVKSASENTSGDYAKDSITVVADAAGSYEVSVWAHKVSSTGIVITTTSGGKSATTKVVTTGNGATDANGGAITADDLVFTWNAPKHPAVDTTYIVTGKVTDKWGNPISAAEVTVDADGALEVNGNTTVARKTNSAGIFRVYFRSLPKVDGIANITATLTKVVVAGTTLDNTVGNDEFAAAETFSNVLSSDVNVGVDAAAVAGSKAGTAKVTAYNLKGKTATVYVAGKKVATIKSSAASKSVTVKAAAGAVVKVVVGSTTYFNEAVN